MNRINLIDIFPDYYEKKNISLGQLYKELLNKGYDEKTAQEIIQNHMHSVCKSKDDDMSFTDPVGCRE